MKAHVKMDVFVVAEFREGAVFKTRRLGFFWTPIDEKPPESTSRIYAPTFDYCFKTDCKEHKLGEVVA